MQQKHKHVRKKTLDPGPWTPPSGWWHVRVGKGSSLSSGPGSLGSGCGLPGSTLQQAMPNSTARLPKIPAPTLRRMATLPLALWNNKKSCTKSTAMTNSAILLTPVSGSTYLTQLNHVLRRVPGTRHLVLGTKYQAPGARYRYQATGSCYQVPGTRHLAPGTRHLVPVTRYPEHLCNWFHLQLASLAIGGRTHIHTHRAHSPCQLRTHQKDAILKKQPILKKRQSLKNVFPEGRRHRWKGLILICI